MRQKTFLWVLVAEAVLCAAWQFILPSGLIGGVSLFTFPFEQIGEGLRALSLSGSAGNVLAIILYVLFCGFPQLIFFRIRKKRKVYWEDGLLLGLGVLMFFVMYLMINPGIIANALGGFVSAAGTGKMILSVVLYSVLVGYLVLRVLRQTAAADMAKLQRYFSLMLYIIGIFFVWAIFGAGLGGLRDSLTALAEGNTMDSADIAFGGAFMGTGLANTSLALSRVFLVIRYVVDVLPYLLDTVIVLTGLELLGALRADRYGEAAVSLAQKLSGQCRRFLAITVMTNLIFNVLQLIFLEKLLVVDGTVELPILSIFFVMIVLLLSGLLAENKELKEDNDLFV